MYYRQSLLSSFFLNSNHTFGQCYWILWDVRNKILRFSVALWIIVGFIGIIIIYRKTIFAKNNFLPLKKESCRLEFFFLSFPSRSDNGAINSIKRKLHISHTYTQSGRSSCSDHRLCTPVAQSSRTITTQMRAVAVVGLWHISNIYFSVSWFKKPCTKW